MVIEARCYSEVTVWQPDTCQCLIGYEVDETSKTSKFVEGPYLCYNIFNYPYLQPQLKCQEHKGLDGQKLLDTLITHNNSFNYKTYDADPKKNRELCLKAKTEELKRIKAKGKPVEVKSPDTPT